MKKKILIIEDDAWLADNYRLLLEKSGWQVRVVGLASEAIDIIDDFKPHVLLLDFILPLKNAPTLLNELQSHTDMAVLPIILCTSIPERQLDSAVLEHYGVRQVFDKTLVTPAEILDAAETLGAHAVT